MIKIGRKIGKISKKRKRNFLILFLAIFALFSGLVLVWISTFEMPDLSAFNERRVAESTKIFDKTGEVLLYDVNQDIKRTIVPFEEISRHVKNATIAIEDREFYQHNGIKPRSFLRAVLINTTSLEFSQGGSTLTQQVIKNSLLSSEKKISRKIKEWVLAVKLEKILSKDEILNTYLNEIPYGGSIYGVEEASNAFFGKKASEISLAESAYLAAIPKAPTFYSPYGKNRDSLEERKNLVLREMLSNGFINQEEYDSAIKETVVFKPRETSSLKAPHFVFFVLDYLQKKYGESVVERGGLRVKTTLDYEIQKKAEEIANRFALENKEKFNAENAAFVVIDPNSGGILAMVGSRNYFDEEIDGNFNIATAERQPGSTFKPFVYAQAFSKGYTPETVLFDVRTQFSTTCSAENFTSENGCYSPENYDLKFRGPMTLRDSLAQSVNITSVKTLYLAGIKESIELSRRMGITTLKNSDQYGLTLVLGGGEVSLLDMVSAYSVFANEGERFPYQAVLEVKDREGNLKELFEPRPQKVLEREVALKISDVLSDNDARAPAFGQTSDLYFGDRDVAVKTGTTNDYRDAWIIGYTPNIAVGAWAGNNDNSPMERRVAGFIVAPMWRALMNEVLKTLPDESFTAVAKEDSFDLPPVLRGKWQGGESVLIDTVSKKLATEYTPKETTEEVLLGGVHSILHWINKNNPRGARPQKPEEDPQYRLWEFGVSNWALQTGFSMPTSANIPGGFDDIHIPENFPSITINSPQNEVRFQKNSEIFVSVSTKGRYPARSVEFFINDSFVGKSSLSPFSFSFTANESSFVQEKNILRVVVVDSVYNRNEAETVFFVEN